MYAFQRKRFSEKEYDAMWAAVKLAKHIRSHRQILHINDSQGTRNYVQVCWSMLANLLPIRRFLPAKRVCGTEFYRPTVEAFCEGSLCPGLARDQLYQLVIMVLSVQLAIDRKPRRDCALQLG